MLRWPGLITFSPIVTSPLPNFEQQGRDFISRFAPKARPEYQVKRWDMTSPTVAERATPVQEEPNDVEARWWKPKPFPTASGSPGHHHHHHHKFPQALTDDDDD